MLTRRLLLLSALTAPALTAPARVETRLTFAALYAPLTATGIQLSAAAQSLVGQSVTLQGFMAPPLKAESDFFVLTRYPMSTCPFCSNAADWPVDIVFVRLGRGATALEPSYAITVSGTLEAGMQADPATGFVSLVRVTNADWKRV